MSTNSKHQNNHAEPNHDAHTRHKSNVLTSKTVLKWAAVILVVLLLFWLFIAENLDAFSSWGNP